MLFIYIKKNKEPILSKTGHKICSYFDICIFFSDEHWINIDEMTPSVEY